LLGRWQLDRAAERRATAASIQAGRSAAALSLNTMTAAATVTNWTPATAIGHWRGEYSVLLENRNLEGRPGLWLATPLLMADGQAVLVLRGWFARPLGEQQAPLIHTSAELQEISGELAEHVPRLFELWSAHKSSALLFSDLNANKQKMPDAVDTAQLPRVQNLTLTEISAQTGLTFLPVVLLQTSDANDGLIRSWPEPSVDADKNVGYAMQWFGFATICLIALLVFVWRVRFRR